MPNRLDIQRRARSEWGREVDPHRRAVNRVLRIPAGNTERLEVSSAVESLAGEVESGVEEDERRLIQLVGDTIRSAQILLDEQPEIGECIGRTIGVVNTLASTELVARRIERRGDLVIDALLPVLRAWPSATRTNIVRSGEIERAERGAVGDLGERCLRVREAAGGEQGESCEKGKIPHRRGPQAAGITTDWTINMSNLT